jgi:predicted MFS family arabinose efflux permease
VISYFRSSKNSDLNAKAWLVVALLCFVGGLNYLDRTMITTMNGSISKTMPMTNAQFGLLTSVFLWVYGLFSPFAGYLADRFNRSRVIIVSLFIWSLVTWLTAYVQSFEQLLLARALMGLSEACYIPAALALISDYHRTTTRSLATGIHEAGITVGASLGFLGGMIGEKYEWTFAFEAFGALGVVAAILLLFVLKDPPGARESTQQEQNPGKVSFLTGLRHLFSKVSFLYLIVFWSLMGLVGWMVMGWLPLFYKENFDLSEGVAGLYATGYLYPASMAGVLVGGYLADRWSKVNNRARILVPAIGLLVAAPCIFMASYTSILVITLIFFMVFAFTRGFTDANMMPILCTVADPRYRATGYGVLNLFSCIVGGVGLYAGGALRDADINLSVIFMSASLVLFVCASLLFMVKPSQPENNAESNVS